MGELFEEFSVWVGDRQIVARVVSPDADRLAARPALVLNFATDRVTALSTEPYCDVPRLFLEHGHRALSFSLPYHGERVDDFGNGIVGLRNAFVAGIDACARFIEEGIAVVDDCVSRGLAEPGRIVVAGTSRAAYMALRLLAADHRLSAGAAFAPVTDWRYLAEFSADQGREDVAELRLSRFVDGLAGKTIYMAIGNHDGRVSTASCCRLYLDLLEANARGGHPNQRVDFICTPDSGHTLANEWRTRGAELLIECLGG